MMKLESTLAGMGRRARRSSFPVSGVAMLVVTVVYLVSVLSVPVSRPQTLVWLAVYPVVLAEMSGEGFLRVFLQSLWVLPIVLLIALFNPVFDTAPAFTVAGVVVSRGWVSFVSILLRGLLSMQAVLLLVRTSGFYDMCAALRRIGCPRILVTQLLLTYRYMSVLVEEALWMHRAREARGFGRKSYPLSMWGRMVGQLLIRSSERASRIYRAMLVRGFDGTVPVENAVSMNRLSILFLIITSAAIIALRLLA